MWSVHFKCCYTPYLITYSAASDYLAPSFLFPWEWIQIGAAGPRYLSLPSHILRRTCPQWLRGLGSRRWSICLTLASQGQCSSEPCWCCWGSGTDSCCIHLRESWFAVLGQAFFNRFRSIGHRAPHVRNSKILSGFEADLLLLRQRSRLSSSHRSWLWIVCSGDHFRCFYWLPMCGQVETQTYRTAC